MLQAGLITHGTVNMSQSSRYVVISARVATSLDAARRFLSTSKSPTNPDIPRGLDQLRITRCAGGINPFLETVVHRAMRYDIDNGSERTLHHADAIDRQRREPGAARQTKAWPIRPAADDGP
jgi:hypothetical protein